MPRYQYQVRDAGGRAEAGVLTASDELEASRLLRKDGKLIVSLTQELVNAASSAVEAPPRRVRRDDIIYLATQLAVMVDTGVPLPEALDSIAEQTDHTGIRALVASLSEDVKGGITFSDALAKHRNLFSPMFVALMRASEASGTMGQMLIRVSDYMVQENDTRKRVKGAMIYPICMLSFCIVVVVVLLVFVLPRFEKIYESKGAALPVPTQVLLGASRFIVHYWPFIIVGLAGAVVGGWYWARTQSGRETLDRLRISLPILGPMHRKMYIARSFRTMATMVSTGVSMLDGLQITREAAGNIHYARIWENLADKVKEGGSLSQELRGNALIPGTIAQMVSAGERTGKLSQVMNRVADFCEDDLKVAIKTLTSMIEPLMIIVMGLLVGGIAISLLLPIFSISKVVAH